jgi:hypothetical protein
MLIWIIGVDSGRQLWSLTSDRLRGTPPNSFAELLGGSRNAFVRQENAVFAEQAAPGSPRSPQDKCQNASSAMNVLIGSRPSKATRSGEQKNWADPSDGTRKRGESSDAP